MEVYFSCKFLTYIICASFRAAKDPIQRSIQATKDTLYFCMAMLSPSNIKAKINELQQMTVPEIFIAFFKMIFYAFYYSGFGVSIIIR
jgi:ryanodine receptor 2